MLNLGIVKYGVIYADPPWTFGTYSPKGKGRSAEQHYDCMNLDDIKALPVETWTANDALLLLWTTDPFLVKALEVMAAWGFKYKTVGFVWAKTNRISKGWFTGMGFWTRANPEICLLGTKGHPKRQSKAVHKLVIAPRQEHSRKPDEIYDRIEALVAGPYLELFARRNHAGWDSWGKEVCDENN